MKSTRLARVALGMAVVAAASTAQAATPVSNGGATSLAAFRGHAATAHRVLAPSIPRNPFMASNGNSNVHDDGWMTDSYTRSGPLGRAPSVFSAELGARDCITLTFDRRGRIVASCISITSGPALFMLDPRTLNTLAQLQLPYVPPPPGIPPTLNTAGGAYFYLDQHDRAVLATTNRHIWVVAETGGARHPGFRRVRDYDVSATLAPDERLPSALPDYSGRIWYVGRQQGTVGVLDPRGGRARAIRLHEEIENSFAVARDGVYIASDKAMYRFGLTRGGAPRVVWRSVYRNIGVQKPGQIDAGTGTTPTIMPGGYVTITDNADPMDVMVYRTAARLGRGQRRVVCQVPVFHKGASDTENSLIVAGRAIVAENNYGYTLTGTTGGALTAPGIARVDVDRRGRGCRRVWTNDTVRAPSVVPKLSLATGLVYTYIKERDPAHPTTDVWSWAALDFHSGRTVWRRLAGTGVNYNNHYAGIALGPDGHTAYLGGVGGIVAVRDGRAR